MRANDTHGPHGSGPIIVARDVTGDSWQARAARRELHVKSLDDNRPMEYDLHGVYTVADLQRACAQGRNDGSSRGMLRGLGL